MKRRLKRQRSRYHGTVNSNAELHAHQVQEAAAAVPAALSLLQTHLEVSASSARVGRRLLKVARTLADLEGTPEVGVRHIARAIGLRCDLDERGAS